MCGINGIFHYADGKSREDHRRELRATRDYMTHRGPDGSGEWWSEGDRVGLGHRRLSILDLTEAGAQPMCGPDGAHVVTFNGEIYNYPQIKARLEAEGTVFRTHADTEILLHLYARYGRDMVHHLRGMFAFAIWDERKQGMLLARDPYGIKPLYTSDVGGVFRFASQVKALLAGGNISREPEPAGVVGFFLWGSVPEPFTLYRDISLLPAGSSQWVDASGAQEPVAYITVPGVLSAKSAGLDEAAAAAAVRDATAESVRAHLLADVEVGLFLSAGVDSAALLGLMRDAGQRNVTTITLAFDEFAGTAQDEAPLAAEIAKRYDARNIARRVSRTEFEQWLPEILDAMDQPSIDGINTWMVARAAKEVGLKVALSGVGADELLGGYPTFRDVPRWAKFMRVPSAVPMLGVATRLTFDALRLLPDRPKARSMIELGGSFAGAYLLRRGLFLPSELRTFLDRDTWQTGLARLDPVERLAANAFIPQPASDKSRITALETCQYMRNQLLRDADWAGMAHGVEIRTPFVDIELLRSLAPVIGNMSAGAGKLALANAPTRPLPASVVDRPKTGFQIPTERWLGDLSGEHGRYTGAASRVWATKVHDHARALRESPSAG